MASDWYAYNTKAGNTLFFYNIKTGEHRWANQCSSLQFQFIKHEFENRNGNCTASNSMCEENTHSQWRPYTSNSGEVLFYYNTVTGEHKWDLSSDVWNSSIPSEPVILHDNLNDSNTCDWKNMDRNGNTIDTATTGYIGVKEESHEDGITSGNFVVKPETDIQQNSSQDEPETQFVRDVKSTVKPNSNLLALRTTFRKRNISHIESREKPLQQEDCYSEEYSSDKSGSIYSDECSNFSDELPEISESDEEEEERLRRYKRRSKYDLDRLSRKCPRVGLSNGGNLAHSSQDKPQEKPSQVKTQKAKKSFPKKQSTVNEKAQRKNRRKRVVINFQRKTASANKRVLNREGEKHESLPAKNATNLAAKNTQRINVLSKIREKIFAKNKILLGRTAEEAILCMSSSTSHDGMPKIGDIFSIADEDTNQELGKVNLEKSQKSIDGTSLSIHIPTSKIRYKSNGSDLLTIQSNGSSISLNENLENVSKSRSFKKEGNTTKNAPVVLDEHDVTPIIPEEVSSLHENTTEQGVGKVFRKQTVSEVHNSASSCMKGPTQDKKQIDIEEEFEQEHEESSECWNGFNNVFVSSEWREKETMEESQHGQQTSNPDYNEDNIVVVSDASDIEISPSEECRGFVEKTSPVAVMNEHEAMPIITEEVSSLPENTTKKEVGNESRKQTVPKSHGTDSSCVKGPTQGKEQIDIEEFEEEHEESSEAIFCENEEMNSSDALDSSELLDKDHNCLEEAKVQSPHAQQTSNLDDNEDNINTISESGASDNEVLPSAECSSTVETSPANQEERTSNPNNITFQYHYSIKCLLPIISNIPDQTRTWNSGCDNRRPAMILTSQYLGVLPATTSLAPKELDVSDKVDCLTSQTNIDDNYSQPLITNAKERSEVTTTLTAECIKQEEPETSFDIFTDKQVPSPWSEDETFANSLPNDNFLPTGFSKSLASSFNDYYNSLSFPLDRTLNGLSHQHLSYSRTRCKCSYCAKEFRLQEELERHLALRHLLFGGVFLCNSCNDSFISQEEFTKHLLLHDEVKPVKCRHCGTEFCTVEDLASHISCHADEPKYPKYKETRKTAEVGATSESLDQEQAEEISVDEPKCPNYNETRKVAEMVGTSESLDQEDADKEEINDSAAEQERVDQESAEKINDIEAEEKPEKRRQCYHCDKNFKHYFAFRLHLRTHDEMHNHSCLLCGKSYLDLKSLRKHVVIHLREKRLECEVCHKTFRFDSDYLQHQIAHVPGQLFRCEKRGCRKIFNTWEELRQHEIALHEEKRFRCTECGKSFARQEKLTSHIRLHTGEKPLECETCGRHFRTKSVLKNHKKIHLESKTFKCPVCVQGFKQKCSMLRHVKTHRTFGPKEFQCDLCKKGFTQSCSLQRHLRIHSGDLFKCPKCPMKFLEAWRMRVHIKNEHLEENDITMNGSDEAMDEHDVTMDVKDVTIGAVTPQ